MDKQTLLNQFYITQITRLIELCSDQSLLDLIYRLLLQEEKQNEKVH